VKTVSAVSVQTEHPHFCPDGKKNISNLMHGLKFHGDLRICLFRGGLWRWLRSARLTAAYDSGLFRVSFIT